MLFKHRRWSAGTHAEDINVAKGTEIFNLLEFPDTGILCWFSLSRPEKLEIIINTPNESSLNLLKYSGYFI